MAGVKVQADGAERADSSAPKAGKSRIKARHLSPLLRRVIVDSFLAKGSSEDVAEELRIPGRTVTDVVLAHALGARRYAA